LRLRKFHFPFLFDQMHTNLAEILAYSRVKIRKGGTDDPTYGMIALPQHALEIRPLQFKYDFRLELETISNMEEERKAEKLQREMEEKNRQEAAWKALEEQKKRKKPSSKVLSDPNALVDLNFDDDTASREETPEPMDIPPIALSSEKHEQLFMKLLDMGFDSQILGLGMEVFGTDDELKLVNFITDFHNLEAMPEKFSKTHIKQALFMFPDNCPQALVFLREYRKLTNLGIKHEQVIDALSMFNNDMKQTVNYLNGYKKLMELGFSDIKIREALVMTNNDGDRAVQYLLENN